MSVEAVNWAITRQVGNGILKATLAAVACLQEDGPVQKQDLIAETGLTMKTIDRHLRLLQFLKFVDVDSTTVTVRMPK